MEGISRSFNRSQEEGTRFEFRLFFKVTRIPSSGWDKLVLSLISVETGKTLKTPKSLVRNGTCQWAEPIIESTKLTSELSTGEYADKLYRIVIQMVSVRVSILGEAVINLSDYANAESPESISLPLMNCNAGSCLDIKGQRIGSYEQEYNYSVSEDNSSNSDVSEKLMTLSVGSSSSQTMSVRTHQMKKGATRNSFPKNAFSSMDSFLPRTDGINGQLNSHIAMQNGYRSSKALSQKRELAEETIQDLREEASKWERQVRKLSVDMEILKQQLTAESKKGADLNIEILARKAECDSLRSELEQKNISKVASKDNYRRWEMDDSKWQINILQEQVTYQEELNADLHSQLSKMHDSYGEIVSALKDLEDSLDAKNAEVDQLKEENEELLKELSNCHGSSESLGGIIDSTEENQYNNDMTLSEMDFKKKLKDKDRKIKRLTSKLKILEGRSRNTQPKAENIDELLKTIEILKKKMEEQEVDCKELTDENIELHYKLEHTSKDLESKIEIITELRQAHEGSNSDVLQDTLGRKLQESRDSIAKLELQVDDLKWQKLNLEQLVHILEAEKKDLEKSQVSLEDISREEETSIDSVKHMAEIGRLILQISDHEAEKKTLEVLLSETTENTTFLKEKLKDVTHDLAETKANAKHLEAMLAEVNSSKVLLEMRIQDLMQDSGNTILKLEIEKANLQKSLDDAHHEIETAKERLGCLLQETKTLRNTGDAISDAKITLEKTVLKLVDGIKELQDQIIKLEAMNVELSERRLSLETQVRNVSEERDSYQQKLEIANANNLHDQDAIKELGSQQSLLMQQLQNKTTENIEIQEKLVTFEIQKTQEQQELHNKEQALRMEIQSLLSEKESIEHRASRTEEEFSVLQKDKDDELNCLESKLKELALSVKEKETSALIEVTELHAKKTELEISLKHMEERCKQLESELSTLHRDSVTKNDEMSRKLDASLISCNHMTQKLEHLQQQLENEESEKIEFLGKVEMLENELQHKVGALSEMEQQILNAQAVAESSVELQERCKQLEDDARASKKLLVTRETEFAQKESDLCRRIEILELTNEQLEAGMVDSGSEQLKNELIRLQTQNSSLSRREQELLSAMHTQEVLEEEIKRLQEFNDLLEVRISKFIETAKNPLLLEKLVNLETELAEAVEANNMYKQQLRSILEEQQNDTDQVGSYKKEIAELKEELCIMRERYSLVSLQLAETEVEKSELQRRVRREVR